MSLNKKQVNEGFSTIENYNGFVSSIMTSFNKLDDVTIMKIAMLIDPSKTLDSRYPGTLEDLIETRAYKIAQDMNDAQFERFAEIAEAFGDKEYQEYIDRKIVRIRQNEPVDWRKERGITESQSFNKREEIIRRLSKK